MQLPKDVDAKAAAFKDLPEDRKAQIISHLKAVPEGSRRSVISHLVTQAAPAEKKFAIAIFGKEIEDIGASPANKATAAPTTL